MGKRRYGRVQPAFKGPHISSSPVEVSTHTTRITDPLPLGRKTYRNYKLARCRTQLQWATGLNSALSVALSLVSLCTAGSETETVVTGIAVCSVVQVWLVLFYWAKAGKFAVLLGRATQALGTIRHRWLLCTAECVYHLVIPLPANALQNGGVFNTLANVLLICRNYHSMRLLYWVSPLSTLRLYIYTSTAGVQFRLGNLCKYCAKHWSGLGSLIVLLVWWLLLRTVAGWETAWTGVEAMTRLGSGSAASPEVLNKLAVVTSICLGLVLFSFVLTSLSRAVILTPREVSFSSALYRAPAVQKARLRAAVLIQAWWKLRLMRRFHHIRVDTVLKWYEALFARKLIQRKSADYSISCHLAHIEKGIKTHINRLMADLRLSRHLHMLMTREAHMFEQANQLIRCRSLAALRGHLPPIKEVLSEQSSLAVKESTSV